MSQNLQNFVKFQKFQLDNLVDFEKCCKTHIFLQKSVPIQPKTSNILPKFCQKLATTLPLSRGPRRRLLPRRRRCRRRTIGSLSRPSPHPTVRLRAPSCSTRPCSPAPRTPTLVISHPGRARGPPCPAPLHSTPHSVWPAPPFLDVGHP